MLPILRQTVTRLAAEHPGLEVVIPAVAAQADIIRDAVRSFDVPVTLSAERSERHAAMAACDVALATSGTVSLDLALCGVPTVIAYRANPLTIAIVRRMLKIRYVTLVNIILDREAIPEFLQQDCRPDVLAEAVSRLIEGPEDRLAQVEALREGLAALRPEGMSPSERAARTVLDIAAGVGQSPDDTGKRE